MRLCSVLAAAWLASVAGMLALAPAAIAQPTVVVRAEARIELRATHEDGAITVHGSLVDDLGEPMARRSVVVAIHERSGRTLRTTRLTTDAEGSFVLTTPGSPTRYTLTASYEGDDYHPRLSVERQADLTRAPTRLRLDVGEGRFDLDGESHSVGVEARGARGGAALAITLLDELGRELGAGTTDTNGRLVLQVPSTALGEPGDGRLVARTAGDAQRAEARVEAPIVRYREATLTLEPSRDAIGPEGEVVLRGTLRTSAGPLANEAIGLYLAPDDTHLTTALTDAAGSYEAVAKAGELGRGRVRVEARFESDGPGTPAAASEGATIVVRGGARTVWAWLALPLLLSLLLLVWLRRQAPPSAVPAPPEPEPAGVIVAPTVRRGPARRRIAGRLEDLRGAPLRGRLRAVAGDREEFAESDAEGRFDIELPDGTWTLTFEAPRHAPAESTVEIPHRGGFEGLRVRLESWRARALAVLRDRFTARGPAERWPKTTVHSLTDDGELGPIAAEVEVSYYGPIEPDGRRVEELRGDPSSPP